LTGHPAVDAVQIISFDEIDSTSAEARRRAEAGEAGPLWITAGQQTAGRGRRGRMWESPPGNLAATYLTLTDMPPAQAAQVSFVAALAAWDVVAAYVGPQRVTVKWPNDLLIDGRKVCGILVESGRSPDGRLWLAVGIGMNLAHPPLESERPATALAEHLPGPPPQPARALERLAAAFEDWQQVWREVGFAVIGAAWTERAYGLGQPCIARLPNETVSGIAEGLDADGALRLRLPDGSERHINAGDVFFEEP
jgi:BirA family transcriptional regulator, biotin operon repressor / biotin---[acetyl-CoA-carboxylase] ligase